MLMLRMLDGDETKEKERNVDIDALFFWPVVPPSFTLSSRPIPSISIVHSFAHPAALNNSSNYPHRSRTDLCSLISHSCSSGCLAFLNLLLALLGALGCTLIETITFSHHPATYPSWPASKSFDEDYSIFLTIGMLLFCSPSPTILYHFALLLFQLRTAVHYA